MSQLDTNTAELQNILNVANALPDASITDVDDALSETSTNPVQNKVVTEAINHHTQSADTVTSGTFAGVVKASSQTPSTSLIRNSKLVSSEIYPDTNGEICWIYE